MSKCFQKVLLLRIIPHISKQKCQILVVRDGKSFLKMFRHHECGGTAQRQQQQRPTANRKRLAREGRGGNKLLLEGKIWNGRKARFHPPFLMSQYYSTTFGIRVWMCFCDQKGKCPFLFHFFFFFLGQFACGGFLLQESTNHIRLHWTVH